MKKKFFLLSLVLLFVGFLASAQDVARQEIFDDVNRSGAVYYAYPGPAAEPTPVPQGYEAFYISHYGRHGSRYLIGDNDYKWVLDLMHQAEEAGALTELGKDVTRRLEEVWVEAEGHGGDLSPLGVRQHRGIAERMYLHYPEVFDGEIAISARSTIVVRCILSMDAFCERLKEFNPKLNITREASNKYMSYLNYHSEESNRFTGENGAWRQPYADFEKDHTHGERLVKALFSDPAFVEDNSSAFDVAWGFYWIAVDMQDMESEVDFYDLFTKEELFDLYQCFNYRFYVCDGNYAGSNHLLVDNAKPLLTNILQSAEETIASGGRGATFRFGHDGNLIPLTALLQLDGCYESVSDPDQFYSVFKTWEIAPMAGNVQIIFCRATNDPSEVIVKFLLNENETSIPVETDIWPYYHWNDVKAFWTDILK